MELVTSTASLIVAASASIMVVATPHLYHPAAWPTNALHIVAISTASSYASYFGEKNGWLNLSAFWCGVTAILCTLLAAKSYTDEWSYSDRHVTGVFMGDSTPFPGGVVRHTNEPNGNRIMYASRFILTMVCVALETTATMMRINIFREEADEDETLPCINPFAAVFGIVLSLMFFADVVDSNPRWIVVDSPHVVLIAATLMLVVKDTWLMRAITLVGICVSAIATTLTLNDVSRTGARILSYGDYGDEFIRSSGAFNGVYWFSGSTDVKAWFAMTSIVIHSINLILCALSAGYLVWKLTSGVEIARKAESAKQ